MLVGTKFDLCEDKSEERTVEYEEAAEFAQENDMAYIETSAKTNHNVTKAFEITIDSKLWGFSK